MYVEALLFLVLMLGVGLGSMATAWATRRPEIEARFHRDQVVLSGEPTPEQVEKVRTLWMRMTSMDPGTTRTEQAPDLP